MVELLNIDCMEYMKNLPDKFFDIAIVDPPYGIAYSQLVGIKKKQDGWKERTSSIWDSSIPPKQYFTELFRVSKNQVIWGGNYFDLPPTRCYIIWDKVQRIDQADCEFAWTSFNKSARIFDYARGNESGFAPKLTHDQKKHANIHPTQKPLGLYKFVYSNFVEAGWKILDTHLGSGSSAVVAEKMGFDFVGCEIDKTYYDAALKRFYEATDMGMFNVKSQAPTGA